ncbi:hypothetical protein [Chitinophaga tropicalis]|uniref:Uncharacterized protein n=1 Tax=Chitinophaga tropicalis TaxID=2683588 RepID=A0A7K1UAL1_9BACT|nr:hypothetical protein [Chitinophaga tropicalis]MVT11383.1 hypothetical protein [Chitinophaga tropicalis]
MGKKKKKMVTIKKEYQSAVVAFGNSGLPLGQRDDLLDLAIIATKSGDPSLLQLFEPLPSLEELQKMKVQPLLPVIEALKETASPGTEE